jgi:hypothetical protein
MQDARLYANDMATLNHLPRGPVTGRIHTASINGGEGFIYFCRNVHGYFYVQQFSTDGRNVLRTGLLFDMEKCDAQTENLQAVDPGNSRYTDAVSIDGCVFSSFALHGETVEAVKAALGKVWLAESRPA